MSYRSDMRLAVLVVLAACGGNDDGVTADASSALDAGVEDSATCAAGTFPMTLTFREHVGAADSSAGPTLSGVHACVITHPAIPCIDTPISGQWSLCAPAESEVAISYEKVGYMPALVGRVTGTAQGAQMRDRNLTLNAPRCDLFNSGGASCPPTAADPGGLLWVQTAEDLPDADLLPPPLGDVSVALTPAAGVGPFYIRNQMVDPNLTATDPQVGSALAGDVRPGDDQVVTLSRPGQTCSAFDGEAWPGPTAGTIRVPIRSGFRTRAVVTCR